VTRHFNTLDAMRGVTALAVLTLHVCKLFDLRYWPTNAHLGVDFFFLLSGLVIANAYEPRLQAGWSLAAFARKRVIRLAPMILVGGALGLAVLGMRQILEGDLGWSAVAMAAAPNLLLAPSPALLSFRPFGFPLNMPFWSLSAEVVINLAYAATARRLTDVRLGLAIGVALAALAAMVRLRGTFNIGFYWSDYGLALVRAAFPFLVGVALSRAARRLPDGAPVRQGAVAVLAAILLTPLFADAGVQFALVALGFPALLVLGLTAPASRHVRGLSHALGELSYPLYAVHYPIVIAFSQAARALNLHGLPQVGLAVGCASAAVVTAWLTLLLFDRPIRSRLELWLSGRLARIRTLPAE
jgi:peptidoglycan/LPS O-acetylase OafA/YrhL